MYVYINFFSFFLFFPLEFASSKQTRVGVSTGNLDEDLRRGRQSSA